MIDNPYLPWRAEIVAVEEEVVGPRGVKTLRTRLLDRDNFAFKSGQCAMLSVFGNGESMISISSPPFETQYLSFSILKMGRVTSALHDMEPGDIIGIRGPYGNGFPMEKWRGKDLVFIAGGIGLAPLWSSLGAARKNKDQYGKTTLVYGARSPGDLVFRRELDRLAATMPVHLSVDAADEDWSGYVGFVPDNVKKNISASPNMVAVVCGPAIMIKFTIMALKELGFADNQIYTTVESKMKCGVGRCGRCSIGGRYVCKDGPVYCWEDLKDMPQEY